MCCPHPHLGHFDVPEVFIGGNHHVASFRFVGDVVVTLVTELCKRMCFVRERFEESLVEDCVWCLPKRCCGKDCAWCLPKRCCGKDCVWYLLKRCCGRVMCSLTGKERCISTQQSDGVVVCGSVFVTHPAWQEIPPPLCRVELHRLVDDVSVGGAVSRHIPRAVDEMRRASRWC